jgi:leader peptidase (prepilin peptidase)/N-methyltransferase
LAFDALSGVLFGGVFIGFACWGARRAGLAAGLTTFRAITILTLGFGVEVVVGGPLTFIASIAAVTVCAATDMSTGYVFDTVTLPAAIVLVAIAMFFHQLPSAMEGVFAAGGAMFVLYVMTLGRGLGLGDVKLACCIGAGTGGFNALVSLGLAFVLGGLYAGFLLVTRRGSRRDEVRFAPYMAAGLAMVLLYRMPL